MYISTIIICRNSLNTLKKCIQSIYNQSIQSNEILVVDGNSNDGTVDFLQTQTQLTYIPQTTQGIANARNLGIAHAKGEYLAFLDADDSWLENALELRLEYLKRDPSCLAVGGLLQKSDDPKNLLPAYTPGGFVFRKEAFDVVGKFNETWKYASDHAWFKCLMQGNFSYKLVNELVLTKGMHDSNTSLIYKEAYRNEMMQILRSTNTN